MFGGKNSLATVYRNLRALVAEGQVRERAKPDLAQVLDQLARVMAS